MKRDDEYADPVDARLAARLAELRAERGWSLGELAERSGVSRSTLSRAERAETSPTAAVLNRLGHRVRPQRLLDTMLRIPARGLTNIAFPLQVAARELARVPARDARVLLLSDCVHNAGSDPRPLAARLPRLDVLLDTSGELDPDLARELARLGRGTLATAGTYRDVAPAVSTLFAT